MKRGHVSEAPTDVVVDGPITRHIRSVLAPNAGPMTLDGTNSLVMSGNGRSAVVVDPGPPDPSHLAALTSGPPVELILITHHHIDHTEASAELSRLTGAPVRAFAENECHGGGAPLVDGEVIEVAGLQVRVVHTPGHSYDSVCFVVESDSDGEAAVLTGDTILGRGTTVVYDLAAYLGTLELLADLGGDREFVAVPAHGPVLPSLRGVAGMYLAHRQERLDQVRGVLAARERRPHPARGRRARGGRRSSIR